MTKRGKLPMRQEVHDGVMHVVIGHPVEDPVETPMPPPELLERVPSVEQADRRPSHAQTAWLR